MPDRKKYNQKGMTYAEVAVCLFVMAIVITPLSISLVSSTKIRVEAEAISTNTLNAEALMEDIKQQLTQDVALKNRREGNRLSDTDPANVTELDKHTNYLTNLPDDKTIIDLKEFLGISNPDDVDRHDTKYNTEKYDYEIAIWNMKGISLTAPSNMPLNKDTLDTAIKLYSNTDASLRFDSSSETEDLVEINIDAAMAKAFEGNILIDRFIPGGFEKDLNPYIISDLKTISFKKRDKDAIESTSILPNDPSIEILHIEPKEINDAKDGYIYTITDTRDVGDIKPNSRGVVILDLRQLIRGFDTPLTFKFINKIDKDDYGVIIKVLRNVKKDDTEPILETLDTIDEKIKNQFNIIAEDTGKSKTIIERIEDSSLENNYLIALIVRDKDSRLGKPGKIVKKMVEVYSYMPNK